jgi:hypothetical protein
MNDIFNLAAAVLLGSVVLTAFFLVVGALFPRRVARTHALAGSARGRAFIVGLINFAFFGIVSFMFFVLADNMRLGILAFPGTVVLVLLILGLIFGLAGVVHLVGERLAPDQGPTARALCGALALSLACATPFVGWFVLLPFVGFTGLGAFILSYLHQPTANADIVPASQTLSQTHQSP